MSNRRFIELSSANRNRNQYPQPAEFEVPFAPSRSMNNNSSLKGAYYTGNVSTGAVNMVYSQNMDVADTVTNGVVEYKWTGGNLLNTISAQTGTTTYNIYVNVAGLTSPYKNVYNYYVGYRLYVNTTSFGIIQSYNPSSGLFTLQTPLASIAVGDNIEIRDPSSNTPNIQIVLPGIDTDGKKILDYEQAYNGYYLIDETRSSLTLGTNIVASKIVSYDFLTRTATLDKVLPGWAFTDTYTIRKTLPNEFLYTAANPLVTLAPVPNYDQIIMNNCIFLDSAANSADNYYNGSYIYVYPNAVANNQTDQITNIQGTCFYINAYVGEYRACFVTSVNPPNLNGPTQYYPSYNSQSATFPSARTLINIVSFSNDNYTPLIYNGSTVSQNETVAYEISLVNLTLPNIILSTGARIAYYPYVYVELSNATAPGASSKNVIYSNNPNSTNALFLVPITDINEPQRTPFIKLDAGSMVQTVKFKPNDCLKFSVFLPDGTLYQTITSDYYSPSGPNVFCQIDALFGIKRLTGV